MSELPFIVKEKKAFPALKGWLKKIQKENWGKINSLSYPRDNIIQIGHDDKPESDWGGKYTRYGWVLIKNMELRNATENIIRGFMGWSKICFTCEQSIKKCVCKDGTND